MTRRTSSLAALFLIGIVLALGGCWYRVDKYCPGCTVVDHSKTTVPPVAPGTDTVVVLVHGARGFGAEWKDVIADVRQTPGFDLIAWSWPGPFKDPAHHMLALRAELQALLDSLPPSVREVIVLAHSAGATISNIAVRQVHVPAGRHMTVALLDPPPWHPPANRPEDPAVPAGVLVKAYLAHDAPPPSQPTPPPSAAEGTDVPREYIGPVGHDPMVAKVSARVLAERRQARGADGGT
jgi:hypothetical protein